MSQRFNLTDDQHITYVDSGTGELPILLLHGGGLDHRMWTPQLEAFDNYRLIAPDARAHGQSSTPNGPYRLVDDVLGLIHHLDLPRVVVVGLSMGAGTAVDLAVEYPERVRGLVVSGSGTSDPTFHDEWVLQIFQSLQEAAVRQDPEAWIDAFTQFLPGPHRSQEQLDPDLVTAHETMLRNTLNHARPTRGRQWQHSYTAHARLEPQRATPSDSGAGVSDQR